MQVSEVTAAATRHQYFSTDRVRTFQYDNAAATVACGNGTHKSGGAAAQNNDIVIIHGGNITGAIAMVRSRCVVDSIMTRDWSREYEECWPEGPTLPRGPSGATGSAGLDWRRRSHCMDAITARPQRVDAAPP